MRGFVKALFVVLVLSIVSPAVPAAAGDISGVVLGPGSVPLPGVTVTATNSITGAKLATVTDKNGQYRIAGLAEGTYTVTAVLPGFHAETREDVVVEGTAEVQVDFSLTPEVAGSIMVTATRRETDVQTTAASITAVSGTELEELGKKNVKEFISAVPGVTTIDQGGGWNRVIFRNVATAINEPGTSTTATYFDDFPVSTSTSDIVPEIRLVDMNRIEVLKGPQGTLFGRSAMGGIVRYIPNKPNTQKFSAGINSYVSSTKDGGVNFGLQGFANVPVTDNLAIRVVGYTFQDDGFLDNIELGIEDFNDETTNGGRFALHWQPTTKLSLDLTYINQLTHGAPAYVTTTRDPGDLNVPGDEGPDIPPDVKARTMISGVDFKNNPSYDFLNLKLMYDFDSFSATFLATHGNSDLYLLLDDREYVYIHSGSIDLVDDFDRSSDIFELRFVSSTDGFLDWIAGAYYEDTENDAFVNDTYYGPEQLLYGFYPLTDGAVAVNQKSKRTTKESAFYGELGFNFTERTRLCQHRFRV